MKFDFLIFCSVGRGKNQNFLAIFSVKFYSASLYFTRFSGIKLQRLLLNPRLDLKPSNADKTTRLPKQSSQFTKSDNISVHKAHFNLNFSAKKKFFNVICQPNNFFLNLQTFNRRTRNKNNNPINKYLWKISHSTKTNLDQQSNNKQKIQCTCFDGFLIKL